MAENGGVRKDPGRPLSGVRMGILGKGGSGKTTTTVLVARELAQRGYQVIVLDADSTNVGLHRAFGLDQPPAPLVDLFGGMVFQGGVVSCPVDDPTPLPNAHLLLDDIPDRFVRKTPDQIFLLSAGKLGHLGPGGGCDGPIAKIARDLIISEGERDIVTLVDLKAGIEDSARGVLTSLDLAVVVVDPTVASVRLAADLREMVRSIREGVPPATQHLRDPELKALATELFRKATIREVLAVLNRVPDTNTEVQLAGKVRREAQMKPVGALREDPAVTMAWLEGSSVHSHGNRIRVTGIVTHLEDAVRSSPSRSQVGAPG